MLTLYLLCSFHPEYLGKFQDWVPHTQRRKKVYFNVRTQTVFERRPSLSSGQSPVDFYLQENLRNLAYPAPI
jgi:hypothetical protein